MSFTDSKGAHVLRQTFTEADTMLSLVLLVHALRFVSASALSFQPFMTQKVYANMSARDAIVRS